VAIIVFIVSSTSVAGPPSIDPNNVRAKKIVCIGDSITQGRGSPLPQTYSWRYPLWKLLIDANMYFDFVGSMTTGFSGDPNWADYKGYSFDRNHEGHWGWTTDGIRDQLAGWLAGYTPDIALILLGTNDFGAGDTVAMVKEEMRDIIDLLRADNANVIIIIGQPFQEWAPFPALCVAYAELAAEETHPNSPVSVVAHAPGWISNPDLPGTHTVDWVHPNVSGDLKLATNWYGVIRPYLTSADDKIDMPELAALADDWLVSDAEPVLYAVDPCTTNLFGWWQCNEGSGSTTYNQVDGNDGTIYNGASGGLGAGGSVWADDPCRGTVLSFDGRDAEGAYVHCGNIYTVDVATNCTWAFWAKQDAAQAANGDVIIGDHNTIQYIKFTPAKFDYYHNAIGSMGINYDDIPASQWIHHAVVKSVYNFKYYRNGILNKQANFAKKIDPCPFYIGGDALGLRWRGYVSEVRLYQRALSIEEVMFLAEYPVHYYPLDSPWNLYDQEPAGQKIINFRDFAVFADSWLGFMD